MDIVLFKQVFDPLLTRHLASKQQVYTNITNDPQVLSILEHIQNVSSGGKRLRPFIVWSLYASQKPDASLEEIIDLLIAVELFHVFCLIHDDIMDEASTRHGVKTIHTFTTQDILKEETGTIAHAGVSQAILAGDILFNQVYDLLNRNTWLDQKTRENVRGVFTTLVDEVCIGQMLDINLTTKKETSTEKIVEKNKLKTAYYSFARPLHIGAIISKREDLIPFIISFGEKIGMLFQIQDDLLDIVGKPEETKKDMYADIVKNQHTVMTEYIRKKSKKEYAEKLDAIVSGVAEKDGDAIKSLFIESGAVTYAQALVSTYIAECNTLIEEASLDQSDERTFRYIIELLSHRTA